MVLTPLGKWWFFLIGLFFISGCHKPLAVIKVTEEDGLDRQLEYVTANVPISIPITASDVVEIKDAETGVTIPAKVLRTIWGDVGDTLELFFPVTIGAREVKTFHVQFKEKPLDSLGPVSAKWISNLLYSEENKSIENLHYRVIFSTKDDPRGGQINGIILKDFKNQLLKRGHIAMHWAPNFSKSDSERYYTMEDMERTSSNWMEQGIYQTTKNRNGFTDSVPEIHLNGKYTFYENLPYFLFESTMAMEKDVELDLLRNDEMTMDSLFTHVVYQKRDGTIDHLKLYDKELDELQGSPISDSTSFVGFYNLDKGYGFASIRLAYSNTNLDGDPSPVHRAYTKISKASGNGRYWNRVLSDTIQTFPKGSRYHEKNAYLVFKADKEQPEKEVLYYAERLNKPLEITIKVIN